MLRNALALSSGVRTALAGAAVAAITGCASTTSDVGDTAPDRTDSIEAFRHGRPATPKAADRDTRLAALGVQYQRVPDEENKHGCTVVDGIEVTAVGNVKLTRPALLTADMAERLGRWVREVVEPQVRATMRTELTSIEVFGSYSCRTAYGRRYRGRLAGPLSQHAFANAVDIGGFHFADGRSAQYAKHWRQPDDARAFLHAASQQACDIFVTTLTPDYDRFHRDHIHIDASLTKEAHFCGMSGRFDARAVPAFARYRAIPPKRIKKPPRKTA